LSKRRENSFDIFAKNGNNIEATFDLWKESLDLWHVTRCFNMLPVQGRGLTLKTQRNFTYTCYHAIYKKA